MHRIILWAALLVVLSFTAGDAGEAPTPSERQEIEQLLQSKGFTRWRKIERDGRKWEIDDAIGPDGREYEIELEVGTLQVIKLKRD